MRRVSIRKLMAVVVFLAVALAVLRNAGELALGMVLLIAVAAIGTRWPFHPSSLHAKDEPPCDDLPSSP
jgi:hypothetical protein